MGHEFETRNEITVDATPEQVWEAIATGPGVDSWFMGRNQIEPGLGSTMKFAMGDFPASESTVTAWEPPTRFAYRSNPDEQGSVHAFEFLVEGREHGSTVVRMVHSGIIGHDSWAEEFDALRKGDPLYFGTLRAYLTYFPGRIGTPASAWAPPQPDQETVWEGFKRGLGLSGTVREGDPVRFTIDGTTEEGVVDSVLEPGFLGVRTDNGLYRFVGGGGMAGVGHHIFVDGLDPDEADRVWAEWLGKLFA